MLDHVVEIKLTELLWEDPLVLIQLRELSKSTMREPDAYARNQLIKRGFLEPDGQFRPEMLKAICGFFRNKQIVFMA